MNTDRPLPPPSSCHPEFAEQARKLCLLVGATDHELARFFDVSPATLADWLAAVPTFARAVAAGRQLADAEVADRLYRRALGYSHEAVKVFLPAGLANPRPVYASYIVHYPPDTNAATFWLANRQPGHWRKQVEAEKPHDQDTDALSDQQLETIVARELGELAAAPPEDAQ